MYLADFLHTYIAIEFDAATEKLRISPFTTT